MTFSTDFVAPAAFYNILSQRSRESPLYLNRSFVSQTRLIKKKCLQINVMRFTPQKPGKLFVSCLTCDLSGPQPVDINIYYTKELQYLETCDKGIDLPASLFPNSDYSTSSNCTLVNLVIVIFVIDFDKNAIQKDISTYISDAVRNINGNKVDQNIYFNMFELACRKNGFCNNSTSNMRSLFSPVCLNRQTIHLMHKLRNTFFSVNCNASKNEISLEFEFKWTSPTCDESKISGVLNKKRVVTFDDVRGNNGAIGDSMNTCISNDTVSKQIFFHYLYSNDQPDDCREDSGSSSSLVEVKFSTECPWCSFLCKSRCQGIYFNVSTKTWENNSTLSVLTLLAHLESCHVHFTYEAAIDELFNLHIMVHRDRSHDVDSETIREEKIRPFQYFNNYSTKTDNKLMKSIHLRNVNFTNKYRNGKFNSKERVVINQSLHGSDKTDHHTRMYYHARFGLPLTDYEFMYYDSDDDIDMSYEKTSSNRGLDEFEDIPIVEKELMKMWNTHVNSFPPYANQYVSIISELFVCKFGNEILRKGLRHNVLVHLLHLMDFNLIRKEDIKKCMLHIDNLQHSLSMAVTEAPVLKKKKQSA